MWYMIVAKRNRKRYYLHRIDSSGKPVWISESKQAKGFRHLGQAKDFIRHNDLERTEILGSTHK